MPLKVIESGIKLTEDEILPKRFQERPYPTQVEMLWENPYPVQKKKGKKKKK